MKLSIKLEQWPIKGVFAISRGSKTEADVVVVELADAGFVGYGECVPYKRYGETVANVVAQIESIRTQIEQGIDNIQLQSLLPAGAARNAIDCALWDLTCKTAEKSIWQILDLPMPHALNTAYTLSLDTPENMGIAAQKNAFRPLLKLKLAGSQDIERIQAVRQNAPNIQIIVDANEGWTVEQYHEFIPELIKLGVAMIEQPFPEGQDSELANLPRPIPICADESCHDLSSLKKVIGLYDMINIKLDKTGGLTEALQLLQAAEEMQLKIMVGCMVGTSLSMAPAFVIAQRANIVDLDGPLLLNADRPSGITYRESCMQVFSPILWG